MDFEVVSFECFAVKKHGYVLDTGDNNENVVTDNLKEFCTHMGEYDNAFAEYNIREFLETKNVALCKVNNDNKLYGVSFVSKLHEKSKPIIWCPVRRMTIKEARVFADITQAEMSELFEIPKRTIEDWERGKMKPPEYVKKLVVEKLGSYANEEAV